MYVNLFFGEEYQSEVHRYDSLCGIVWGMGINDVFADDRTRDNSND